MLFFILKLIFCFLIFLIIYPYLGYPIVLEILGRRNTIIKENKGGFYPSVTVFIPAYNEAKVIKTKIKNSLALDYPRDKLEIIVASDGSTDNTENIVRDFSAAGVILFKSAMRKGKNFIINEFIPKCNGEIIIFTDANCLYKEDAVKKLIRNFSDENVGCVVGNLRYIDEKTLVGKGEGFYFRYESMIKKLESRYGTLVAANGSIYAIRKSLFVTLDLDVANDLAHPIQIADKGYKIVFEPEAIAYEKATSSFVEEFSRRSRIVTRGLTAFIRYWRDYHMLKGMWGFCFISHKFIRWFIPFFLIMILLLNFFLYSSFFRVTLYSQLVFYSIGFIGIFSNGRLGKFFSIPLYFCLINLAALVGILKYFSGKREAIWNKAESTR